MEQDQPKQQKEEKYPKSDLNTNKDKRLRKGSQVNSKANVLQRSKKVFSPSSTTTGPTVQNVLAVKDTLSKVRNNHDTKKRASDANKTFFPKYYCIFTYFLQQIITAEVINDSLIT